MLHEELLEKITLNQIIYKQQKKRELMITNQLNLDKYEGHTEGEWILNRSEANPTEFLLKCGDVTITWLEPSEADAQLMADAPLLLAEVKRLREDIQVAIEDIEDTLFHTQEFIEGLLDYLKGMIE